MRTALILPLFWLTLFAGAVLTFLVQPLVARMVLPLFGGSPSVWNTCVLFFQAGLLAGYAYAHLATAALGVRRQSLLHLALLLVPLSVLPVWIGGEWAPASSAPPALWLLAVLALLVGLPYLAVSATAPLLQKWYSATGLPSSADPYFLYVASNLGSLLALLAYPLLLEPGYTLREHTLFWTWGYLLLLGLVFLCSVALWTSPAPPAGGKDEGRSVKDEEREEGDSPSPLFSPRPSSFSLPAVRLRWVALAFVPSSLMLSVTTYLTTDVAPIPLLWVTPLLLYLLTFILTFARRPLIPHWLVRRYTPMTVLVVSVVLLSQATQPIALLMGVHLLGLFVVAMMCHGELARSRPPARQLTGFYLWLSVGGVLGGAFNTLVAPLVFVNITEYPLALVLACLLLPRKAARKEEQGEKAEGRRMNDEQGEVVGPSSPLIIPRPSAFSLPLVWDFVAPVLVGAGTVGLIFAVRAYLALPGQDTQQPVPGFLSAGMVQFAAAFALPAVVVFTFDARPVRFALGIAALFAASLFFQGVRGEVLYAERSFFGVHRVAVDPTGTFLQLFHGNTVHGQQFLAAGKQDLPLTYYHPRGPAGKLFAFLDKQDAPVRQVGLVGLGVGSLAYYARPGQTWTFYEIDPAVLHIARDSGYFHFLENCRADRLDVVLGDARLRLAASEASYDVLVVDAFNSDSLPVHLLTREALRVYLDHLRPQGVLAYHVSNNYLDVEPVLAELAADAGLHGVSWQDSSDFDQGKFASHWVVLSRDRGLIDRLSRTGPWFPLQSGRPEYQWTDDFSNVLRIFRWGGEPR